VHRYPLLQQALPQQDPSYGHQPPLGQSSVKLGQPWRRVSPKGLVEFGWDGRLAPVKSEAWRLWSGSTESPRGTAAVKRLSARTVSVIVAMAIVIMSA